MRFRLIGILFLMAALVSGSVLAQDDTLELEATVQLATDAGDVTLMIPNGWPTRVISETEIYVGNSAGALDNGFGEQYAPGEVQMIFATMRVDSIFDTTSLTDAEIVYDVMEAMLASSVTEGALPETLALRDMDGIPVASAETLIPESASYALIRMVSAESILFIEIITAPKELESWIPLADAVFASVDTGDEVTEASDANETSAIALTETYVDEAIPLTVDYPAGWVTRGGIPNGVYLASSEEALELQENDHFMPGAIRAFIGYGRAEDQFGSLEVSGLTPAEIFEVGLVSQLPADSVAGEIETLSIHDLPAATITLSSEDSEIFLVLTDYGDGYYLTADIRTAVGELDAAKPILLAMLETVEISAEADEAAALPLEATYASEDGRLTISYPEGWFVRPGFPFSVDIANTEAGLDLWLYDSFAPGDVRLSVGIGTGEEMFEDFDQRSMDVVELMAPMVQAEADDERVLDATEPEALTINGQPAAASMLTLAESENYAVIIEYDDFYAVASVQTPVGELEPGKALLLAMLATLEVGL